VEYASGLASKSQQRQAQTIGAGVIYKSLLQQSDLLAYVDDFRWLP